MSKAIPMYRTDCATHCGVCKIAGHIRGAGPGSGTKFLAYYCDNPKAEAYGTLFMAKHRTCDRIQPKGERR